MSAHVPSSRIFVVLGRDSTARGFAYVDESEARRALPEADQNWPSGAPHRVVPFVPEVK